MSIATAFCTLVVAWLISLFLTPLVSKIAKRLGAVDNPDGHRKNHSHAVSTGGGVAVAISSTAAILLIIYNYAFIAELGPMDSGFVAVEPFELSKSTILAGLLPAALVLVVVGLVDDLIGLTGIYKLIGQIFSVSLLVAEGFHFDYISLFWMSFPLGNFAIPFTIFFCLGAINAFNLIDGIDGLASSIGAIVFLTLGIITASDGDMIASVICFSFVGSLLGFLRFNVPPAKIYLGDTGSMLIGLVVAAVAIRCSIKEQAAFAMMVPVAICAIPIFDASMALVRRITTGQSVFTPDRGHLHHALLLRGWSVAKTVSFISGLTAVTCGGALASFFTDYEAYALVTTSGVFIALAATKLFGHVELKLVSSHSRTLIRSALQRARQLDSESEKSVHLQGTRKWETIWQALIEAAPVYNLSGLRLRINIPIIHESFYADWKHQAKTPQQPSLGDPWEISLPLKLNGNSIGKLTLQGKTYGLQATTEMLQVLDFLEPFEAEIEQIISDVANSSSKPSPLSPVSSEKPQEKLEDILQST